MWPKSRLLDRIIIFAGLVALWQLLSLRLGIYWVSSPLQVLTRTWTEGAEGDLLFHAGYTMEEALIGFLIGGLPAALLPFGLRRLPRVVAILDPFMVGGYGLPKLALAPLFILWFGIDIQSKVALVAIATFFIVYFATLTGVRSLDVKLVDMARVLGASERQIARHVVWPGAVPFIFAGFRVALPYSIGGAVVAEMISSNRGLGYFIQIGAMNFDTTQIFVAVVMVTLIVLVTAAVLTRCEAFLLRWRPPADTQTMRAEASI